MSATLHVRRWQNVTGSASVMNLRAPALLRLHSAKLGSDDEKWFLQTGFIWTVSQQHVGVLMSVSCKSRLMFFFILLKQFYRIALVYLILQVILSRWYSSYIFSVYGFFSCVEKQCFYGLGDLLNLILWSCLFIFAPFIMLRFPF